MRAVYLHGVAHTKHEQLLLDKALKDSMMQGIIIAGEKITDPEAIVITLGDESLRSYTYEITTNQGHCYVLHRPGMPIIIPCLHPSAVLKDVSLYTWFVWAFQKASNMATGYQDIHRNLRVQPTFDEVISYIQFLNKQPLICIDIEKEIKDQQRLTCLGIGHSKTEAMSIPFVNHNQPYWKPHQESWIRRRLIELFTNKKVTKVFQNYLFDTMCLDYLYKLPVDGKIEDTMLMASFLNPQLPKGLKDLARIYSYCGPWKGGQDWSAKGDVKDLWIYNAKDVCITLEIYDHLKVVLGSQQKLYEKIVQPMIPLVKETCLRGIKVNQSALLELGKRMSGILLPVDKKLTEAVQPLLKADIEYRLRKGKPKLLGTYYVGVGKPVMKHNTKGEMTSIKFSEYEQKTPDMTKQLKDQGFWFERVEKPSVFNPNSNMQMRSILKTQGIELPTKDFKETTDAKAMLKLARKYPANELIPLYIERAKASKIQSTYSKIELDSDSTYHFMLNIGGTVSGRFSSNKNPWKTGGNIQNIPRDGIDSPYCVRNIFVPRDGMTLVQVDLSQAEARVVAWLSRDEHVQNMFANNIDVHVDSANAVYGEDISVLKQTDPKQYKIKRQMGKLANHSLNYGLGASAFADNVLKQTGTVISIAEAKRIIDAFFKARYKIKEWHDSVRQHLATNRQLVSPYGRTCTFLGRYDDNMVREALSFIPQATVADTINSGWQAIVATTKDFTLNILQQGHDSLLMETTDVKKCCEIIDSVFDSLTFVIDGKVQHIPHDISIGTNWAEMKDCE